MTLIVLKREERRTIEVMNLFMFSKRTIETTENTRSMKIAIKKYHLVKKHRFSSKTHVRN
jgi:hypothetical protein